ncbi:phage tail terminator-like protein [Pseudomonas sp. A-RE-26]|uniref:phage tail terminator-like protein n=1 Tax=Pseudomonas sp. A-RE-26 TaxID=2832402 RepID=UPI001CBCF82B|nr:phage tail terminator-like protein [Pseudomonas sp. A-RE-26]
MSHAIIASIYEAKLIAWSKARAEPIKVVFENVQYDPADGETYLRAFLLPGDTASSTLAGDHRAFIGVYQVSIVAPAGTGKAKTNPLVVELTGLFRLYARDTKSGVTVVTMSPVEQGPGITDAATYMVPASFEYRADTGS